jgi:hypothetical protein
MAYSLHKINPTKSLSRIHQLYLYFCEKKGLFNEKISLKLKKQGFDCYIIEEYPTADALEVEPQISERLHARLPGTGSHSVEFAQSMQALHLGG